MEVSKYILLFHKKMKGEINPREQEELGDWLQQENRYGFAEELEKTWNLSKRYKESYEPDVEAGLSCLQQRITDAKKASNSRRLQLAAGRRRPFGWMSVAAAIAFIAAAGWWWMGNGAADPGTEAILIAAGAGKSTETTLPDGSAVVLNENSSLVVSSDFRSASRRQVELAGEAYFKIEPNPSRPFLITTREARVEVVGTAFNLRAYPQEGFTEVEVEEGTVRLSGLAGGQEAELGPGQRGTCRPGTHLEKIDSPALNAHSWRTQRLQFRDTPLGEALPCLERHFGVELELASEEIAGCSITMKFEDFTLQEVFKALELIFRVEVQETKGGYVLKGGACETAGLERR